jgi:hypothetical protein
MSIPSLRSHPQPTFDHGRDRFVFGFDTDAVTGVGVTRILSSKSKATLTPQSLFKKIHHNSFGIASLFRACSLAA